MVNLNYRRLHYYYCDVEMAVFAHHPPVRTNHSPTHSCSLNQFGHIGRQTHTDMDWCAAGQSDSRTFAQIVQSFIDPIQFGFVNVIPSKMKLMNKKTPDFVSCIRYLLVPANRNFSFRKFIVKVKKFWIIFRRSHRTFSPCWLHRASFSDNIFCRDSICLIEIFNIHNIAAAEAAISCLTANISRPEKKRKNICKYFRYRENDVIISNGIRVHRKFHSQHAKLHAEWQSPQCVCVCDWGWLKCQNF